MSRGCPKKEGKPGGNGKVQSARGAMMEEGQPEEEEKGDNNAPKNPPPYDPTTLMSHIHAMSTEERDGFLDCLMMAEEDF